MEQYLLFGCTANSTAHGLLPGATSVQGSGMIFWLLCFQFSTASLFSGEDFSSYLPRLTTSCYEKGCLPEVLVVATVACSPCLCSLRMLKQKGQNEET